MSETNLRNGLGAHMAAMPDVPPIDFENVGLDQDKQIYLSQRILPAEDITVGMEVGGTDILAGLYQITINIPKSKKTEGWQDSNIELEKIKAHFQRSNSITEAGTRIVFHKVFASPALPDENYYRVPVSIRYRAI